MIRLSSYINDVYGLSSGLYLCSIHTRGLELADWEHMTTLQNHATTESRNRQTF